MSNKKKTKDSGSGDSVDKYIRKLRGSVSVTEEKDGSTLPRQMENIQQGRTASIRPTTPDHIIELWRSARPGHNTMTVSNTNLNPTERPRAQSDSSQLHSGGNDKHAQLELEVGQPTAPVVERSTEQREKLVTETLPKENIGNQPNMFIGRELEKMESRLMEALDKLNNKVDVISKTTADSKTEFESRMKILEETVGTNSKRLSEYEESLNYAHKEITDEKKKIEILEKE